jgi:hypothetical protein
MLQQLLAQTEHQLVIIIDDMAAVKACATLVISEFQNGAPQKQSF